MLPGTGKQNAWYVILISCHRAKLTSTIIAGGIPDVAADAAAFHDFLDKLEVEIKTYGYQPKLNFVYGTKP